MAQLRLTRKFAKDLHITKLQEPQETTSIFDDWVVDVIRVQRKKVAMVTHVKSYLPFFLPYCEIGGANNIIHALVRSLTLWLLENGYSRYRQPMCDLFAGRPAFCKTANRKVLGHMNDYKRCAPFVWLDTPFDKINWFEAREMLENMPITVEHSRIAYPTPKSLMLDLLDRDGSLE